jgi:hypothetical protein
VDECEKRGVFRVSEVVLRGAGGLGGGFLFTVCGISRLCCWDGFRWTGVFGFHDKPSSSDTRPSNSLLEKRDLASAASCKTVGYAEVRHRFRRYSSDETCLA